MPPAHASSFVRTPRRRVPSIGAEIAIDAAEAHRHRFDAVTEQQDRRMKRKWRDLPIAAGMLAPSAVILGVFVVYPLVRAVQLGHLRCDATGKRCREGGWGQYIDVFRSNEFQHALANTARLALMTVPIGLALGIGLAVLADKQIRGIGFFRTVFSSTVATSVAVASLVWFVLLQPEVGVLPDLLHGIIPVAQAAGPVARPGHCAARGRAEQHLGQPRVHVHRHHRGAAGHPSRAVRERLRRWRRRLDAVQQRHLADARPDDPVHLRGAHHSCLSGLRRDRAR